MSSKNLQTFNDGYADFFEVENDAAPGNIPTRVKSFLGRLRYHARTVGINRFYAARQEGIELKNVLRFPRRTNISTQNIVVLQNGEQLNILQIQYPEDVRPPCMDLTLREVMTTYELDGFAR